MKKVKVIKLDEFIREVNTNAKTVGEILKELNVSVDSGYTIQVNGINATQNTVIDNGAIITIAPNVEAGI